MRRVLNFVFILGFVCSASFSLAGNMNPDYLFLAKRQVKAIDNYDELSNEQIKQLESKAIKWLVRIKQLKDADWNDVIPADYLNIHTGLVHQTYNKREINVIPGLGISYVPDLELYYTIYLKYYAYLLKYGSDTPLPEVIMGMLNRETRFLWIKGDGGHSIAPCQLHRATAKWLLASKKFKDRFGKMIYFDKKGEHHFYSQETMVEFMYEFLINTKHYAQGRERNGIAAYNGSKPEHLYTSKVVAYTIQYLAMRALAENIYSPFPMNKQTLISRIKKLAYKSFEAKNLQQIRFEAAYQAASDYYESKAGGFGKLAKNGYIEQAPISVSAGHGKVLSPDVHFGKPYVVKDKDVFIFSYFRNNLDTTVFYHNKIIEQQSGLKPYYTQEKLDTCFIYLYYDDHKKTGETKRIFIKNVKQYKEVADRVTIQCNKVSGKIYTIPNYPVYYKRAVSKKNTTYPPSFFLDNNYLVPALRKVRMQ